jgi:archaellum biogenesis protein FlaJ (TadC family)
LTIGNILANLIFLGILVRYNLLIPKPSDYEAHRKPRPVFKSRIVIQAAVVTFIWVVIVFLISIVAYWPATPVEILLDSPFKFMPFVSLGWLVLCVGMQLHATNNSQKMNGG